MEPWGTPAKAGLHDDFCRLKPPFEIYLIDSFQESYKALQKCQSTWAYKASLYARPLSNAFDISKKTDLTSRGGLKSNASKISCVIASNWLTQESDGRNPDWFGFKSLSSKRNYKFC